jgi:quercetin dioxygenase-like cupin family protein
MASLRALIWFVWHAVALGRRHLTLYITGAKLLKETCLRQAALQGPTVLHGSAAQIEGAQMSLTIRRVVTGHDQSGRAVVSIDETCKNVISRRPNHASCVVWSTGECPADNGGDRDGGTRKVATTDPHGTVFRLVEYAPGVAARNHRTESIDYAVVMSGEIDMEMDGTTVHLRAGDVLVQRGTIHNWSNRGAVACTIAFVLVAAKPVERAGKVLGATN